MSNQQERDETASATDAQEQGDEAVRREMDEDATAGVSPSPAAATEEGVDDEGADSSDAKPKSRAPRKVPPPLDPEELRSLPLFKGFSDKELRTIADHFRLVVPPKNPRTQRILFEIGSIADGFFLLLKGDVTLEDALGNAKHLMPKTPIGELGAFCSMNRNTRAIAAREATVYEIKSNGLARLFVEYPAIGLRYQQNLLAIAGEKIQRDQARIADMRGNLIRTQHAMKNMRDQVEHLEQSSTRTYLHDTLDRLIEGNRRVHYRVKPPSIMPVTARLDDGRVPRVIELSRTHVNLTYDLREGPRPLRGQTLEAELTMGEQEVRVKGHVHRVLTDHMVLEFDTLPQDATQVLEGYLTRTEMLDFLV